MAQRKSNKLPNTSILKRCSSLGKKINVGDDVDGLPLDVPKGHFAIYVGENRTRYIVPSPCSVTPSSNVTSNKPRRSLGSTMIWDSPSLARRRCSVLSSPA